MILVYASSASPVERSTPSCPAFAAAPESKQREAQGAGEEQRQAFAKKAGRVVGMAAETFNDGLRAYYMAFAAVGWFFSPLVFLCATVGVIYVLYQREFRSDVLAVLNS